MLRKRYIVLFVVAVASRAAADPVNLHMRSPSHLVTSGGSAMDLPPGYFLDEQSEDKLDAEMKRLQTAETRLTAENKSMQASLSGWQPGLYTLAGVLLGGLALGYYLERKL